MKLRLGYIALTDAAVLIAAVERGFTAGEGLEVELVREPSWATVRDRLVSGHLDGAHLLAPLAIATTLGMSGPRTPLTALAALNLNGNAVTVSTRLWAAMERQGAGEDVRSAARAFAAVARDRAKAGERLRLATVFPFSTHTYQLRLFSALGGLPLEDAAHLAVVPPLQMVEALRTGSIDGFCVGSPWNSVAVEAGIGRIAALGSEIAPDSPEKVFACQEAFASGDLAGPVVRALAQAAGWCADPENREELAAMLGAARHLALDPAIIRRSLEGRLVVAPDGTGRGDPRYLVFGAAESRPDPNHVRWLVERMREAGQPVRDEAAALAVYRPDLFDAALA